ncbi:N-acetyltransferase [Actinomadura sp. KC06]|uniref:GNAT family N-acetyltransferase n=1 Tax=Actinomadura sp. KC06 TaxID=2530369 RepID=UPI0010440033|nr:GNAT family N-acetyltransferase [Actinomadura sp. KC06]TDD34947.1 N-acetyltransferase [Actinomadura sp. KC06]
MSWTSRASAVLENDHALLTPIAEEHREPLRAVAMDPDIWRYFVALIETPEDYERYFAEALADQAAGRRAVYVITDRATGGVAGSTSFGNIQEAEARIEVGWSWLGADYRGTYLNRWAKLLMLRHAFEELGAERVEFKTDELNVQARRGLRNIGAQEEGILRSFNYMPGGRRRNAVFYSILRPEWPTVKEMLEKTPAPYRLEGTG